MDENKYYIRIEKGCFGFVVSGIHVILDTDIAITNEDYNRFFDLQEQGKQFRLREISTGTGLFDYIEEYTPEVIVDIREPGRDEFMLDIDYRLSKLELGV